MQKEATYYKKLNDNQVQCYLCPHHCIINPEKRGLCKVRKNIEGTLVSEVYGQLSALNIDPIEKKPLYHFHPQSMILSIGSIGCNLFCDFCQNCDISQSSVDEYPYLKYYDAEDVVGIAMNYHSNIGIAYTYNEPTVWYEFMYDIAREAKKKNLKNVMVSNGFISQKPLEDILPLMDAFNVDLKAFTEHFYSKLTKSNLMPVLDTLKTIRQSNKHLELTNLVIPGWNDDEVIFSEMIKWIKNELGEETVLHLSRYSPRYKLTNKATPIETLNNLKNIAQKNLKYVYLGNV